MDLAVFVGNDSNDARQFVTVQVGLHGCRHFGAGGWLVSSGEICREGEHSRQQEYALHAEEMFS
jgi:hypothetical protein